MPEERPAQKKKLGTGAKWAIGCSSGCLTVLVLAIALGFAGYAYIKKAVAGYETELKGLGFETVIQQQMVDVTQPITQPVLLKGQMVRIMADCSTNIAVLAQVCEINGKVDGKIYFRGQVLTIGPNGEVLGGIDAQAQFIQNNGRIEGEISGKYQLIPSEIHSDSP
jgi:hypothetical protein